MPTPPPDRRVIEDVLTLLADAVYRELRERHEARQVAVAAPTTPPASPESPWRRVADIAAYFDVGPKLIYAAVAAGHLKALRVGRALRIHIADAEAWARARAEEP